MIASNFALTDAPSPFSCWHPGSTHTSTHCGELLIEEHNQKRTQTRKQDTMLIKCGAYVLTGPFYPLFPLFTCTCFSLDFPSHFLLLSWVPALKTPFKVLYGYPHMITAKWSHRIYSEQKINVTQGDFFGAVYQDIITGDRSLLRVKVFHTPVLDLKSLQTLSRDQIEGITLVGRELNPEAVNASR